MELGIFAKTFPRATLEDTLDSAADHDLTHVQFNMSCMGLPTLPDRIEKDLCVAIARAVKARGLAMAAISGTFNLCDPDADRLDENLRRLDILAGACRWLDTRIITLCTGTLDPNDMWKSHPDNVRRSTWETLVNSVRRAVQIADRHEITLAFEPEIHNVVSSTMRARRLLDEINSPWLKLVIDPANLLRPGERSRFAEILDEAFEWLGKDIVLAHAKDPEFDNLIDHAAAAEEFLNLESTRFAIYKEEVALSRLKREHGSDVETPRVVRRLFYYHGFYEPYIQWLNQIGYSGALVMHGLSESQVKESARVLRSIIARAANRS